MIFNYYPLNIFTTTTYHFFFTEMCCLKGLLTFVSLLQVSCARGNTHAHGGHLFFMSGMSHTKSYFSSSCAPEVWEKVKSSLKNEITDCIWGKMLQNLSVCSHGPVVWKCFCLFVCRSLYQHKPECGHWLQNKRKQWHGLKHTQLSWCLSILCLHVQNTEYMNFNLGEMKCDMFVSDC